ncbi:MAG: hypothetical protein LAO20_15085 [Acidobacteriia bacterium]|nr:hypothetical protein [Terriglobia bacterium]
MISAVLLFLPAKFAPFNVQLHAFLQFLEATSESPLGAQRIDVLSLFLRRSMLVAVDRLLGGAAGTRTVSSSIRSLLFQLGAFDLRPVVAVCLGLLMVTAVAAFLSARRATKVDPLVALRYE